MIDEKDILAEMHAQTELLQVIAIGMLALVQVNLMFEESTTMARKLDAIETLLQHNREATNQRWKR